VLYLLNHQNLHHESAKAFTDKRIIKNYICIVQGKLPIGYSTCNHFLLKTGAHYVAVGNFMDVSSNTKNKIVEASLSYESLCSFNNNGKMYTLIKINLLTGRKHQIRAQMAFIGHPIVGDYKYGASSLYIGFEHIALHAYALSFPHPISNQMVY